MFGIALSLVLYTWVGYPALLLAASRLHRLRRTVGSFEPSFSIVVAVHNEETHIAAKLEDCLRFIYPSHLIEILVASDGSNDRTEEIVKEFAGRDARVKLVATAGRAGKSGAQNLAPESARGDILLFTDAETRTRPDLLGQIAQHFVDPRIGLVATVASFGRPEDAVSRGQSAYWRFEILLRQLESDLGILATASGQAFALRRELFRPIPVQFGDDCIVPLDVRLQGFNVVQDPQAMVWDEMPHTVSGEFRARVRMTARNWSGILSRPSALNPFRFPATAWGLISHKFLRWMTPLFLGTALVSNSFLAIHRKFAWALAAQGGFYLAALLGAIRWRRRSERLFAYPFAFCLANAGFFLGLMKSLRGSRVITYK